MGVGFQAPDFGRIALALLATVAAVAFAAGAALGWRLAL